MEMQKVKDLKRQLSKELAKQKTLGDVLDVVCKVTGFTPEQIREKGRGNETISDARHLFVYLINQQLEHKYTAQEAGDFIGRDHATFLHSKKKAADLYATDLRFKKLVNSAVIHLTSILFPMSTDQKMQAIKLICDRIDQLKTWLTEHPNNPYRGKVLSDVRALELEREQLQQVTSLV